MASTYKSGEILVMNRLLYDIGSHEHSGRKWGWFSTSIVLLFAKATTVQVWSCLEACMIAMLIARLFVFHKATTLQVCPILHRYTNAPKWRSMWGCAELDSSPMGIQCWSNSIAVSPATTPLTRVLNWRLAPLLPNRTWISYENIVMVLCNLWL